MLTFHKFNGADARPYLRELARLRLKVFYDYPYLYEGTEAYEKQYLETYFKASRSFIYLVQDEGKIVGATTSIWASEEEESFRKPFIEAGINADEVFYFGESVLLPEYRGLGLGKKFFEEREIYARSLPFIKYLAFCAVERDEHHPLKPKDYRSLDSFWMNMGFSKERHLKTSYLWKDRNENKESYKNMQFWLKKLS